jgi:hypothetical protein
MITHNDIEEINKFEQNFEAFSEEQDWGENDCEDVELDVEGNGVLRISFINDFKPIRNFFYDMNEKGFKIEAEFYDEDYTTAGLFKSGKYEIYDIENMTKEQRNKTLPKDLWFAWEWRNGKSEDESDED